MDTNWCLACDCHFEGPGPYCSADCHDLESYDGDDQLDDEVIYHHVDDIPNGSSGILAWAAEIPPHSPSTPSSSRSSSKTPSPRRLPKLLRPNQRPAPPALCVTTPRPVVPPPARPILTHQYPAFYSRLSLDAESMGKTSLFSALTESSLATPASTLAIPIASSRPKPSILGAITTHVRSWVAPPAIASPSSPSRLKHHISLRQSEPHKFTVVAHARPSPALDISYSSFDDSEPTWKLSTARPLAREHSRARGRKLLRK